MSLVTSSYAREWDALLGGARSTLVASHRATTSSRRPGRVFRGTIYVDLRMVVVCPACGGSRRVGSGAHAPRMAGGRLVDCVGRKVTP